MKITWLKCLTRLHIWNYIYKKNSSPATHSMWKFPGQGINMTKQWTEPSQWHQLLNLLCHKRTPKLYILILILYTSNLLKYLKVCNHIYNDSLLCHYYSTSSLQIFFFLLFRTPPVAYGGFQPRVKSELRLPAYTTAPATQDPSHVCNLH